MKQENFIQSNDSTQSLHYITWSPDTKPVGVLQLVHGMEEYIDRYDSFANLMVSAGWAVIGHDHLGHGQSGKWERGFFTENENGADILIADMHSLTMLAKKLWQNVPVFIFGHSMGSFFTRRYLSLHGKDVSGAIICGSGWYSALATGMGYWAARLIGSIKGYHSKDKFLTSLCSLPFLFAFRNEGKNAWLSKNKENVDRYNSDSLCGFGFTCGGYRFMYKNLLLVSQQQHFDQLIPIPLLVISGEKDPVGGKNSVKKIASQYRRYGFADVTEKILEDERHEILFEANASDTMQYIANWLNAKAQLIS